MLIIIISLYTEPFDEHYHAGDTSKQVSVKHLPFVSKGKLTSYLQKIQLVKNMNQDP